MKIVDQ
jgi:hypothetical protein